MDGPKRVAELGEQLGVEQSLLSHHLRVLREMGLLATRRDGKAVVYALAPEVEGGIADRTLDLGCCQLSFDETDSYGFRAVGVGLSEINSDKICGLSLCSEKMSTVEILEQYLQSKGLD